MVLRKNNIEPMKAIIEPMKDLFDSMKVLFEPMKDLIDSMKNKFDTNIGNLPEFDWKRKTADFILQSGTKSAVN